MFEKGDKVKKIGGQQEFTVVGTGPGEFYTLQLGSDGASKQNVKGSELELVAKAKKPDSEPGFVPSRPIM